MQNVYIFFNKVQDTLKVYGSVRAICKDTNLVKPDRLYSNFGRKLLHELETKEFRIVKTKVITSKEEYTTK